MGLYFLIALLLGAFVLTYLIFQPFLAPLALAAVFAVVLQPAYRRILARMPRWPSFASLITVLISIVCMLVPLGIIGSQIGFEAGNLFVQVKQGDTRGFLRSSAMRVEEVVVPYVPSARGLSSHLSEDLSAYAETALQWFIQNIGTAFSSIAGILLKSFLFFIALYYLLRDGPRLKQRIIELSPLRDNYDESIFDKLELAVNSVIKGNLTIALIQGILTSIGFTIFGVPNSILWGSVTAIAALIPGVGTGLVIFPTVIFLFLTGNVSGAIGLAIWGVLAVGLIDNFLSPHLIGRGVKLHPLLVLLSVLGGLAFFGPIGIFLGPLSISLLFAFLSIYSEISKRAV